MARYAHWLQKLKRDKWPSRIVCVDCVAESIDGDLATENVKSRLVSWSSVMLVMIDGEYVLVDQSEAEDAESFWDMLAQWSSISEPITIVAYHCSAVCHLLGLWDRLQEGKVVLNGHQNRPGKAAIDAMREVRFAKRDILAAVSTGAVRRLLAARSGLLVIEDPPFIAEICVTPHKTPLTLLDLRNYGIDLETSINPGTDAATEMAYIVRDFARHSRKHSLGGLCSTVGQQAATAFRRHYYSGGIFCATNEAPTRLELAGYCGGRCECFKIGDLDGQFYHVDRRSAYGAEMRDNSVPVRLDRYWPRPVDMASDLNTDRIGYIARVKLDTEEPAYPVKRGGIVVYPVGRFETVLCGPELDDAWVKGRVNSVSEICSYDMRPALRNYANAVYAARVDADRQEMPHVSAICKRMLACLPGKFAQTSHRWIDDEAAVTDILWGEWIGSDTDNNAVRYRSIAGHGQRSVNAGLSDNAVPAIAAWITSAARMSLLRTIRRVGWDNVYYCDTDSLILSQCGYDRLLGSGGLASRGLGDWTLRAGPGHVKLCGIKSYWFDGKLTQSGLPRGRVRDADDAEHYWYTPPPSASLKCRRKPIATETLRRYAQDEPYKHGVVLGNGDVLPIVLHEF